MNYCPGSTTTSRHAIRAQRKRSPKSDGRSLQRSEIMTIEHSKYLICYNKKGATSVPGVQPPSGFKSRAGIGSYPKINILFKTEAFSKKQTQPYIQYCEYCFLKITKNLGKMALLDKFLGFLLVFLLLMTTVAHAQQTASGQLPDVTLQLKWYHHFQFAGYYAALEQGFYLKEGLNVSLIEGGPEVPVAKIVAAGEADFGVLGSELVLDRLHGKPLVLLAVIFQHSTRVLMVREDSKIASPSDLVGQRFMLNLPESAEFWVMFEREGIPRKALDVIQKDRTAMDKLISGEIAAMNGSVGDQPFVFRQRKVPVRLIRPIDYGIDFYGDALFTSEAFLEKHPDQVAAIRRATIRGWQYAMSHVDEVITLIMSKYTTGIGRDALRFEAESMRTLILPELVDVGHVNLGRIGRIAETYVELGLAPEAYDLDGFLYDPDQPVHLRWIRWVIIVMLAVVALTCAWAAILYAFNRRLRKVVETRTQELSRVNKELQKSEKRMRLFFERQITGMAITSPEKGWLQVNDTLCGMLGYTHGELLRLTWAELTHPDDLTTDEVQFNRLLAGEIEGYVLDKRFLRKDGSVVYTNLSVGCVRQPDGRVDYVLAALLDITERKQAEEALAASEQRLNDAQRMGSIGSWVQDIRSNKLIWSDETFRIFEIDKEFPGDLFDAFQSSVHPEDREAVAKTFNDALKTKKPYEFTHKVLMSDGRVKHVHEYCETEYDKSGNPVKSIGTVQDITERKESFHALQEANIKLQSSQKAMLSILENLKAENKIRKAKEAELQKVTMAIEQAGEAILITDPAGTIEYVNPAFETVSGYTPEEALGKTSAILKSGQQTEAFYKKMWETITSGQVWHGHLINKRKDHRLYTEETTISPVFDAAGKIINYVGVKRDITAELDLTAQFQQAQKMESVGRLAGGVAHDYNNMLSVILGYTEMAMDKVDPSDPLHEDLQEIFDAARRSTDITRQLLAFARKQAIVPVLLDLNTTVDGMLKMLRRLIGEAISLAWLPAFEVWPVKVDPSQVDQILANLCVNARDAINGIGKITIETANVSFDDAYCAMHREFTPGAFVMLAVSDDGCGIENTILDQIFEPFFTTKGIGKGTGLGLATVYGIVKQNHGFINVYSEPENGTTIKIYIPRDKTAIVETKASGVTKPLLGRGETILLVEDESALLVMAKRLLENLGYTILSTPSPDEALRLAEEHASEIQLLLTDVIMPEMNGRDLAQRLSALYPSMKHLFMSGYTADVIAHQGILEEGVNFIQKPLSQNDLAAKVRKVLDSK